MTLADPRTCAHPDSEPVEVRSRETGAVEVVARICADCLEQLPAAWGCTSCQWAEDRRLCDPVPTLVLTTPCEEHA